MNAKKLKPGLVASYNHRPGNGEGLFWFQRFIKMSLTYLLRRPLTYSAGSHTGQNHLKMVIKTMCVHYSTTVLYRQKLLVNTAAWFSDAFADWKQKKSKCNHCQNCRHKHTTVAVRHSSRS